MTQPSLLPPEFIARGFDTEEENHRLEVIRALAAARRQLDAAFESLEDGNEIDTKSFRQLVVDAAEAAQRAHALAAVRSIAKFAKPGMI